MNENYKISPRENGRTKNVKHETLNKWRLSVFLLKRSLCRLRYKINRLLFEVSPKIILSRTEERIRWSSFERWNFDARPKRKKWDKHILMSGSGFHKKRMEKKEGTQRYHSIHVYSYIYIRYHASSGNGNVSK